MTFNMQKAKEIAAKCQSRDDSIDHDYWNAHAGMFLPTALDEIERLRAENAGWRKEHEAMHDDAIMQATRIAEQVGDIKKLKEDLSEVWQVHDEQAKRIADLEGNLYVARLEERLVAFMMDSGPGCTRAEAQAALAKIRGGKP